MARFPGLSVRELTVFAMLGALMFCSKLLMEVLPNIHPLGMLSMCYTLVYRKKAIIPIAVYLLLQGVYAGFNLWWLPYVYLWPLLWAVTLLLPRNMSNKKAMIVYPAVCALHGLLFGTLYAPAQALMYGLSFQAMLAWILAGLPYDLIHATGNLFAGLLILPLSGLLRRLDRQAYR